MQPRIRPGTRVAASTFVELVVTMFLLVLFASLAFPLFWGATKASTAQALENTAQQSRLTLVSLLPRLSAEVLPPYWENPAEGFAISGAEYRADYFDGEGGSFLVLRKEGEARLVLATPKASFSIDNLPGLALDWWKKDGRTIGFMVTWRQGAKAMEFRSAWGSFPL
jgi:hypothetical protein